MFSLDQVKSLKEMVFDNLWEMIGEYSITDHYSKGQDFPWEGRNAYPWRFAMLFVNCGIAINDKSHAPLLQLIDDVEEMVTGKRPVGEFKDTWVDANPNLRFFRKEYDRYWTCLENEDPMDALGIRFTKDLKRDEFRNFLGTKFYENKSNEVDRDEVLIREWREGLRTLFVRSVTSPVVWDKDYYCKPSSENLLCNDRECTLEDPVEYALYKATSGLGYVYDGSQIAYDADSKAQTLNRLLWKFRRSNEPGYSGVNGFTSIFEEDVRLEQDGIYRFLPSLTEYVSEDVRFFRDYLNMNEDGTIIDTFELLKEACNAPEYRYSLDNYLEDKELWNRYAILLDTGANRIFVPFGFRDWIIQEYEYGEDISCRLDRLYSGKPFEYKTPVTWEPIKSNQFNCFANANFLWDFLEPDELTYRVVFPEFKYTDYEDKLKKRIEILTKRATFMEAMTKIATLSEEDNGYSRLSNVYTDLCRNVLFTDKVYNGYKDVFRAIREFMDSEYADLEASDLEAISEILETAKAAINDLELPRLACAIRWDLCQASDDVSSIDMETLDEELILEPLSKIIHSYCDTQHYYKADHDDISDRLNEISFAAHLIHMPEIAEEIDCILADILTVTYDCQLEDSVWEKNNRNIRYLGANYELAANVFFGGDDPYSKFQELYEKYRDSRIPEFEAYARNTSRELQKEGKDICYDEFFMKEWEQAVRNRFLELAENEEYGTVNPLYNPHCNLHLLYRMQGLKQRELLHKSLFGRPEKFE